MSSANPPPASDDSRARAFLDALVKSLDKDPKTLPKQKDTPLLKALAEVKQTDEVKALVRRIEDNEFHDFASPHVAPMLKLIAELRDLKLHDIADQVEEDKLSATPDED